MTAAAAVGLLVAGLVTSLFVEGRQTTRERDKARYALSFLVDTFKSADPFHTRGVHLTAAEVTASRDLVRASVDGMTKSRASRRGVV